MSAQSILARWRSSLNAFCLGGERIGAIPLLPLQRSHSLSYALFYRGFMWLLRHLSLTGLMTCFCAVFFFSYITGDGAIRMIDHVVVGFLLLVLIDMCIGWWARPRLKLHRQLPELARANEPVMVEYTMTNERSIPALRLHLDILPQSGLRLPFGHAGCAHLAAGETLRLDLPFLFSRRGHFHLCSTHVSSLFPVGLWTWGQYGEGNQRVIVTPHLCPVTRFDISFATTGNAAPKTPAMADHASSSQNFLHLREYRPGDPPRMIHWLAMARLGEPAVKEFASEAGLRLNFHLDTGRESGLTTTQALAERQFEAAVTLMASIVEWTAGLDALIETSRLGPETIDTSRLPPPQARRQIMIQLARVSSQPDPAIPALATLLPLTRQGGLIVIFSADTPARRQLAKELLPHRSVRIFSTSRRLCRAVPEIPYIDPALAESGQPLVLP